MMILLAFSLSSLTSEKKELHVLREKYRELVLLKGEFLSLKQMIDGVEGKRNISDVKGVIQAIDEVFLSLGLKDKVRAVKSIGKREVKDGFIEEAELQIEKVSMNEMLNIFYRIEHVPMILTIKKTTIKKSFENPELFNITIILSFLSIS